MERKKVYLSSMFRYEEFNVPHIYVINDVNKYLNAVCDQEASIKTALSLVKLDYIIISCDAKTYSLFNDKEFFIKDFDHSLFKENNNGVINLLSRIKDFVLNKESDFNEVINIDSSIFNNKSKEEYLNEYVSNDLVKNALNNYLDGLDKEEANKVINSIYCSSNLNSRCLKENNIVKVIISLYGNSENNIIDVSSVEKNIEKLNNISYHIDFMYDAKGVLNNDYYFLSNVLNLVEKKNEQYSILGVIDIARTNDEYISRIYNSNNIPDASYVLSLINGYSSTGKISVLKKLKKYFEEKGISKPSKYLSRYISALSFIESGVGLCNIATLKFGLKVLKKVHDLPIDSNIDENARIVVDIFRDVIKDKFGKLINDEKLPIDNLIEWCINNEYYQQTLTIIESLIPDEIVNKGIFYYAKNKNDANLIIEKWNYYYWKELSKSRYIFGDLSHYFIKNYGRNAINNSQPKDKITSDLIETYLNAIKGLVPKLGMLYTNLNDETILSDLLFSYYHIGSLRNEVAHALPQQEKAFEDLDNLGEDELYCKVKREINNFYILYKKALAASKGDRPYIIFNRTFKEYTSTHKPEFNNEYKKHY